MRLKVLLEVDLEVDEGILEENNEALTGLELGRTLYVMVSGGPRYSCQEEAIEVVGSTVKRCSRVVERSSASIPHIGRTSKS